MQPTPFPWRCCIPLLTIKKISRLLEPDWTFLFRRGDATTHLLINLCTSLFLGSAHFLQQTPSLFGICTLRIATKMPKDWPSPEAFSRNKDLRQGATTLLKVPLLLNEPHPTVKWGPPLQKALRCLPLCVDVMDTAYPIDKREGRICGDSRGIRLR